MIMICIRTNLTLDKAPLRLRAVCSALKITCRKQTPDSLQPHSERDERRKCGEGRQEFKARFFQNSSRLSGSAKWKEMCTHKQLVIITYANVRFFFSLWCQSRTRRTHKRLTTQFTAIKHEWWSWNGKSPEPNSVDFFLRRINCDFSPSRPISIPVASDRSELSKCERELSEKKQVVDWRHSQIVDQRKFEEEIRRNVLHANRDNDNTNWQWAHDERANYCLEVISAARACVCVRVFVIYLQLSIAHRYFGEEMLVIEEADGAIVASGRKRDGRREKNEEKKAEEKIQTGNCEMLYANAVYRVH